MVVIHSAQPEAYEPRVGLAKVSAASRKVRARGHFGQINKNLQNDPSSEPDEISKNVSSWRTPNYSKLHIDDGTGDWSGGGNIGRHEDIVHWIDSEDPRTDHTGEWDDFLDYKWGGDDDHDGSIGSQETGHVGYFSPNRYGIFHYGLITHEIRWKGLTDKQGLGEVKGDDFIIAGEEVEDSTSMAKTFAHELTHHFGVRTQYTNKKSLSYSPVDDSTNFDFTSSEWNTINNGMSPFKTGGD